MRFPRCLSGIKSLAALTLLFALPVARPAVAQNLFTIGNVGQFGMLDVTTGTYTAIGSGRTTLNGATVGLYGIALASDNNLYGIEGLVSNKAPRFFQINKTTGTLTTVATLTSFTSPTNSYGIGNTSDGAIYGFVSSTGSSIPNIYNISTAGSATLLGPSGFFFSGAIGGDGSGNLFGIGGDNSETYRVNRTSGAATQLSAGSGAGDVFAIGYTNNALYALNTAGNIYTINTITGVSTNTNVTYNTAIAGVLYGAAPITFASSPEPSTFTFLGISLVGGASMVSMVRQRKARRGSGTERISIL